jgi:type IX secretion system PorP/SprF family membrane protein
MRRTLVILILALLSFTTNAQQVGTFSHSFYKPMLYNPAFSGSGEDINAMIISRSQWIDFKNSPQLNVFTLDGMTPNRKIGLGAELFSDRKGISSKIGGNLYYSYWLKLGEESRLSFGLSAGLLDHTLNYSSAVVENANDPALVGSSQKETSINANAGIGFRFKKFELGVSVPQLLGAAAEFQDNTTGSAHYALSRYYQASIKYGFMVAEEKQISITPLAVVRYAPNIPFQYDLSLQFDWKDKFWIGGTYKSEYAVAANAGVAIKKQLYLGYAYDFIIGPVGEYSGMAHEIMLNMVFGKGKEKAPDVEDKPIAQAETPNAVVDSLKEELEIKENKIANNEQQLYRLNQEIAKLKTENKDLKNATQKVNDSSVVKANTGQTNEKVTEKGVWLMPDKKNEVNYLNGKAASAGFYVIAGSYVNRELAQAEVKRLKKNGFKNSNLLFSPTKQYNYIFVSFQSNREGALKQVEKLKSKGIADAWILTIK